MKIFSEKLFKKDVLIIGGGPAGMAATDKLYQMGITNILMAERAERLGGLLPQCIHDGFGLIKLGRNITGPEYADIYEQKLQKQTGNYMLEATVTELAPADDEKDDFGISAKIATVNGTITVLAKAVLLATGCRERGRGAAGIPGSRPAGVYSAGLAQSLMNLHNLVIGKSAVIVGSGDIGLIMARRLTLEGVDVKCIVEIDSISGGLARNIRQCVRDFNIPMYMKTSVEEIYGSDRVTGVRLSNGMEIDCDTVILSVGLIPENSLLDHKSVLAKNGFISQTASYQKKGTQISVTQAACGLPDAVQNSVFICGNALYVHGLVDDVSSSGERVAEDIAEYLKLSDASCQTFFSRYQLKNIETTRDAERKRLAEKRSRMLKDKNSSRRQESVTCILCPNSCEIMEDGTGGRCSRGAAYAEKERTAPKRVLTTSVMVWSDLISVRTSVPIPIEDIPKAMERIRALHFGPDCASSFSGRPLPPRPLIRPGDVLVKDFIDGADLIATRGNIRL